MANAIRFLCWAAAASVLLLATSTTARAEQGKALFDQQCAGCHSLGGGDGGGPDLQGITKKRAHTWLIRIITEPEQLTAEQDPIQAELVKTFGYEMPNLGISPDDAKKIIAFLAAAADTAVSPTSAPAAPQVEMVATAEIVTQGQALLVGSQTLAQGGAPCLSCHPFSTSGLNGGSLSIADLNASYQRMGDAGMKGALKTLKFPIMKQIYADRPLNDDEVTALMAFFKASATETKGRASVSPLLAGGGLFVLFLLGLALYKRRIG